MNVLVHLKNRGHSLIPLGEVQKVVGSGITPFHEYSNEVVDRKAQSFQVFESTLWITTVGLLLLDLLLTYLGLQLGLQEMNPLARSALEAYGFWMLIVLKLGAISVAIYGRMNILSRTRALIPIALGIPWAIGVLVNLWLVTSVTI